MRLQASWLLKSESWLNTMLKWRAIIRPVSTSDDEAELHNRISHAKTSLFALCFASDDCNKPRYGHAPPCALIYSASE